MRNLLESELVLMLKCLLEYLCLSMFLHSLSRYVSTYVKVCFASSSSYLEMEISFSCPWKKKVCKSVREKDFEEQGNCGSRI